MARVLIIDDDDQVRTMLRRTLETAGHSVSEAANGKLGVAALGEGPVDLIITDIYMPEQEGLETIVALRRDNPELPVIAISGGSPHADIDFLPIAQRLGANVTLPKPVDRDRLLSAVDSLAGSAPA